MCQLSVLEICEGDSFKKYIRLKQNDQYIHWNNMPDVRMDVANLLGVVCASYTVGDGLVVSPSDDTYLIIEKAPAEKELPPSIYERQFKFPFSNSMVKHSPKGKYIVHPSIIK